ncbi:hypothetical protein X768_14315 [Mesorhizobium sp. LSJC265A00]|nr:hypothetical protein X768_14315 [Mesorhizobium sp. LSJC265A00]ESX20959.1 hypothetical protein X766_04505 [Mesorhizobium sp. LSJC255A00]ESX91304.1 hypothetical protein X756_02405 [Mesorhizobium sp. LSHC412B00]
MALDVFAADPIAVAVQIIDIRADNSDRAAYLGGPLPFPEEQSTSLAIGTQAPA